MKFARETRRRIVNFFVGPRVMVTLDQDPLGGFMPDDNPKGAIAVATGSTNNPVQDGTARAFFTGVIVFAIGIGESRLDWLTDSELATLLGLVAAGVIVAGGFFDKYIKPRLPKA